MAIDRTAATAIGDALDVLVKDSTISDEDTRDTLQFVTTEANEMTRSLRSFARQETRAMIQTDLEDHAARVRSGMRPVEDELAEGER